MREDAANIIIALWFGGVAIVGVAVALGLFTLSTHVFDGVALLTLSASGVCAFDASATGAKK